MFDVAVIGLGAMGSASLAALARSGLKVIGLEQFRSPHQQGSSHGNTRVIRETYFEDPAYVPLLQEAYRLWDALQQRHPQQNLWRLTGGLMLGPAAGALIQGCLRSAQQWSLPHQQLCAADIQARFPTFKLPDKLTGIYEPRAGLLHPEACIQAFLDDAATAGAHIQMHSPLLNWEPLARGGFRLQSPTGIVEARKVVWSTGAWLTQWLPALPLQVTRQLLFWFSLPDPGPFQPERFPIFLIEYQPEKYLYGFPDTGQGFKVAIHAPGRPLSRPDLLQAAAAEAEELTEISRLVQQWFPQVSGPPARSQACMYTNTPDHHFILDRHPQSPDMLVLSPCSGHGFKFSSIIGELVVREIQQQDPGLDLSLFRLQRFQKC